MAKVGAKAKGKGQAKAKSKAGPKAKCQARAKRGTANTFAGRAPPQNPDLLEIHNTMKIKFQELSPEQHQELAAVAERAADDAYWKVIHIIMGDRKNNFRRQARQGPGVHEGSGTAQALVEDCHTELLFFWEEFKSNGFKAQISAAPSSAASSSGRP